MLKSVKFLGMEIPTNRITRIECEWAGVTIDFRDEKGGNMRLMMPLRDIKFVDDSEEKEVASAVEAMERDMREALKERCETDYYLDTSELGRQIRNLMRKGTALD